MTILIQIMEAKHEEETNSDYLLSFDTYVSYRSIPDICHGLTDDVRGEKIGHVENFQISVHDRCGEL